MAAFTGSERGGPPGLPSFRDGGSRNARDSTESGRAISSMICSGFQLRRRATGRQTGRSAPRAPVRLLALGNEILADDAFGFRVADEAERRFPGQFEIVRSSSVGFDLLDSLAGASRLLIVDTILTGSANPGAISVFRADRIRPAPNGSPHFLGLFEVLAVARRLSLPAPEETMVMAVEASDCTTVGGAMHPDVLSAIPKAVELAGRILADGSRDPAALRGGG